MPDVTEVERYRKTFQGPLSNGRAILVDICYCVLVDDEIKAQVLIVKYETERFGVLANLVRTNDYGPTEISQVQLVANNLPDGGLRSTDIRGVSTSLLHWFADDFYNARVMDDWQGYELVEE